MADTLANGSAEPQVDTIALNGTEKAVGISTDAGTATEAGAKSAEAAGETDAKQSEAAKNENTSTTEDIEQPNESATGEKAQAAEAEKPRGDGRAQNGDRQRNQRYNNSGPKKDYSKNVKSNYRTLPESDDPVEIRKQVEFYFSDSNLAGDKFLFTQTGGSENKPVPITTIHDFKRMKHFQPFSAVVAALKDSDFLDIVDNDTAIVRKVPLATDAEIKDQREFNKVKENEFQRRSVYVKGFGEETESTQVDIEKWFEGFGKVNQVRLRRHNDKKFKGSVFAEFKTEEEQQAFLALDPAPKFQDKELVVKSKQQYCDEKVELINAGKIRPSEQDPDDWKTRRQHDQKNGFRDGRGRGRDHRGGGRDHGGDRGGGGRGFGRGGGRGGPRGRGDRNRDRAGRPRTDRNEENAASGNAKSAVDTPATMADASNADTAPEQNSKKRALDSTDDKQESSKKVREDA